MVPIIAVSVVFTFQKDLNICSVGMVYILEELESRGYI